MIQTAPKTLNTGLGLRHENLQDFRNHPLPHSIDFLEIAPENWMRVGGERKDALQFLSQHYPFICHGLSLSLGSPAPLDTDFLNELKIFLDTYNITTYSEHLSFCSDEHGMLFDLHPLPFTEEAVHYVASRIRQTQEILERRIALENISYYTTLSQELSELEFINAIVDEADCELLLDINNIYVNSQNHHYDAEQFLTKIHPRVNYFHVAGHDASQKIIIDTHGEHVSDPVWALLKKAYERFGVKPTLLERDNNIPLLAELLKEIHHIKLIQQGFVA